MVIWQKVNRIFRERTDHWWAGLTGDERAALIDASRNDGPVTDPASFSALLFAYRVATLALERAAPPVDPTGRSGDPSTPAASVHPSLADLSEPIPVTDAKAWVAIRHLGDDVLASRVRSDLTGPGRTLSAGTRQNFVAWEQAMRARSQPGAVRKVLGFADPPEAGG